MPSPAVSLRRVVAETVRPIRRLVLRAGLPPEASVYPRDDDPATIHFGAFTPEGDLVGIATYLPGEDRLAGQPPYGAPGARFRGMAVLEGWRGRGVGTALLAEVLREAREHGVKELWANARLSAVSFYTAHGFQVVSSEFELSGVGPHMVIAAAL